MINFLDGNGPLHSKLFQHFPEKGEDQEDNYILGPKGSMGS
jgi:hypothetical protein